MDEPRFEEQYFQEPEEEEQSQELVFDNETQPLTKEQEDEMLFSIRLTANTENLLDLSCQYPDNEGKEPLAMGPKYWEFVEKRLIEVSNPITISDGYITSYKLYKVRTRKAHSQEFDTVVERRYSDFEYLHSQLIEHYGGLLIPHLPHKNIWATLDLETPDCRTSRKQALQQYLTRLLAHPKLRYLQQLALFLFDRNHTFSQKKGGFCSQNNYEEKLKQVTSEVYGAGFSLLSKYFLDSQSHPYRMSITKQDNEIEFYKVLVSGLEKTVKQLKIIVESTVKQCSLLNEITGICTGLSQSLTIQIQPLNDLSEQNNKLLEDYEEIFEFIRTCQGAIERRETLRESLEQLKSQEESLRVREKQNPRNASLDMVRAEIQKVSRKYEEWTKELLVELDSEINLGKSMLAKFVFQLEAARCSFYSLR